MYQELIKASTNVEIFWTSFNAWTAEFSVNSVIMLIMVFFTCVGAVDKISGNKKGYGEKFDEGFLSMGPMAIAMVGTMCLVPILKMILEPIIAPIYQFFGASPAMFAGTILPIDAGAYPLALQMAEGDVTIASFSGLMLGGTMGVLIIGLIPLAMALIEKEDIPYFSQGVLVGLITVPFGCLIGGLLMNLTPYTIDLGTIVKNLIVVMLLSVLIALGLWFKPTQLLKGFTLFGKGLQVLITLGAAIAIFQFMTGLRFPLFYLMVEAPQPEAASPLIESLLVVGNIGLIMTGAFPLVHWLTKTFSTALTKLGKKLELNEVASSGLVATLASVIPTLGLLKEMNPKGKFLNIAFSICAAWAFGDHLGYIASVNSDMLFPVTVGKLVAAVSALWLANKLSNVLLPKISQQSCDQSARSEKVCAQSIK